MIKEVSGDLLLTRAQVIAHGVAPNDPFHTGLALQLRELAKLAEAEKFTSLALPRIATGVGRLAWTEVKPLLGQHLGALKIPVIVYATCHAGQQAAEGL